MIVEIRLCEVFGREVHLPPKEFLVLQALIDKPERFFSREELINYIQANSEEEYCVNDRTIDTIVKRLRQRLFPKDPALSKMVIQSIYKGGYRIARPREEL